MVNVNPVSLSTPNPNAGRVASEQEIERQRQLALEFANRAARTEKIANPLQGINYVAQNALAGVFDKKADKSEAARREAMAQALTGAIDPSSLGIDDATLRQIIALDPSVGSSLLSAQLESRMAGPEVKAYKPGDVIGSVSNGQFNQIAAIPEAPEPVKPYSNAGQVKADLDAGYLTNEEAQQALANLSKTGVTVNVGPNGQQFPNPPFGQDYRRNPDGTVSLNEQGLPEIVTVPGGPQATEAAEAGAKEERGQTGKAITGGVVGQEADRAIKLLEESPNATSGVIGWLTSAVPFLPSGQVNNIVNTIRFNAALDKLQAVRDASPTGGAVGQVSNFEQQMLMGTIGSLVPGQPKETMVFNLQRVQRIYDAIVNGVKDPATGQYRALTGADDPLLSTVLGTPPELQRPDDDVPQGVSPEEWKLMTPEERALWPR